MNLEDFMLSEISQSQEDKYSMIQFILGTLVWMWLITHSQVFCVRSLVSLVAMVGGGVESLGGGSLVRNN